MADAAAIEALVRRFPDRANRIRRLHAADAKFGAICEDYADALRALHHWQTADQASQKRVEEYSRLVKELEDEALGALDADESG